MAGKSKFSEAQLRAWAEEAATLGPEGARLLREQLGIAEATVRRAQKRYGITPRKRVREVAPPPPPADSVESMERTYQDGGYTITGHTREPVRTLDDLIRVCGIDTAEWEVKTWTSKAYQMGSKAADGEPRITQLFAVSATLRHRVEEIAARAAMEEVVAEAALRVVRAPLCVVAPPRTGYMLGLSIADAHNGKLCWGLETGGADYDLKLAVAAQERAFETLVARSSHLAYERILLVLGNDGLHVDSNANTTTKGTPQDVDSRHFKTFGVTWRAYVDQIERARQLAPVLAVVMPGNHDQQSMLHIGEVLTAWFRNDPHVQVDNRPMPRKYVAFGANLIGVQHGDSGKPTQWAQLMPVEAAVPWSQSRHRHILTGHLHTERMEQDEVNGVKVWRVPSLAPPDYWHAKNGYVGNKQAALAFHWHASEGLVGTAAYTVPPPDLAIAA